MLYIHAGGAAKRNIRRKIKNIVFCIKNRRPTAKLV